MLIFFGSFHRHDFILLEKRLFVVVTRRPSARSGKWLEFATLDGKLTRIPATSSALEPKICSSCVGMTQLLCEGVWTRPGNRRAQLFSVVLPIYVFIFFHRCFIIEFLHGCSNGSTFFYCSRVLDSSIKKPQVDLALQLRHFDPTLRGQDPSRTAAIIAAIILIGGPGVQQN